MVTAPTTHLPIMNALYGRDAGRWCSICNQTGSHHTDRHEDMVEGAHAWMNSLLTQRIEILNDADGVALMDTLRVSTKVYNSTYSTPEALLSALNITTPASTADDLVMEHEVRGAFRHAEYVRVGPLTDRIRNAVPGALWARWSGYIPLNA